LWPARSVRRPSQDGNRVLCDFHPGGTVHGLCSPIDDGPGCLRSDDRRSGQPQASRSSSNRPFTASCVASAVRLSSTAHRFGTAGRCSPRHGLFAWSATCSSVHGVVRRNAPGSAHLGPFARHLGVEMVGQLLALDEAEGRFGRAVVSCTGAAQAQPPTGVHGSPGRLAR
jgi:hypothetical protein